jgi:hypothetical protein
MARGGAVRGYADGTDGDDPNSYDPQQMADLMAAANNTGYAPAPPPAQVAAPQSTDPTGLYADIRKRLAASDNADTSKDKWMALLQAGLGTMAAASQPGAKFLGSIGQGGMLGVEGLQKLQAQRAERDMKNLSLRGTLAEHEAALDQKREALAQQAREEKAKLQTRTEESEKDRIAKKERTESEINSRETIARSLALIAQQNANTAKAAEASQEEARKSKIDNPTIPTKLQGEISQKTQEAMTSANAAENAENLAKRFEVEKPTPGILGSVGKIFKSYTGNEDYVTEIQNDMTRIRSSGVLANLPPGSASDKDRDWAQKGFPSDTSSPAVIADFLRSYARLKKYQSSMSFAHAGFVSENRELGTARKDFVVDGIEVKKGSTYPAFMKQYMAQITPPSSVYNSSKDTPAGQEVDFNALPK